MGSEAVEQSPPKALRDVIESRLIDPSVRAALDRAVRLVASVVQAPTVLIALVRDGLEVFLAHQGLPASLAARGEIPVGESMCAFVMETGKLLVVADISKDASEEHRKRLHNLHFQAYAGAPIVIAEGVPIGTLCVFDTRPHEWSNTELDLLKALAVQIAADVQIRWQSAQLATQLQQQQAIEADRQQMTRLNVHDLRTPLSAMMMSVEMIGQLGPLSSEQDDFLKISKRNGEALMGLLNNLIDIGSIDHRGRSALTFGPCPPNEAIAMALHQIKSLTFEQRVGLKTRIAAAVPTIMADCDKLVRVLVNLIANAIKFNRDDGEVEISVAPAGERADQVQFTVHDTGIGMTDADHLFDEGVRLDKQMITRRSTGLGLTFCKRIVEAHGGKIWFKTQIGVGTSFFFTLPIVQT